jgi:hypothetical protein
MEREVLWSTMGRLAYDQAAMAKDTITYYDSSLSRGFIKG